MNRFCTLTLLLTLSFITANAQYTRHIVAFRDKKGTVGTIANPSTYLSAKAIARRTKYNIVIDSTDLPISKPYLDSIALVPGVTILNQSKWLNQVLIRITDPNALIKINSFPFVKSAMGIAPRIAPEQTGRIKKNIIEEEELPVTYTRQQKVDGIDLDYGSSMNQIRIHKGEYLHNLGFTGQTVTIAILDAGFRNYKTNPALDSVRLQGRFLGEWDYVANHASVTEDDAHGGNCLTIIAANRPGLIVGSAPHSKFWLLRTEDVFSEYPVEEQNWAAGAEFADSAGADMISSSLGYTNFDDPTFTHSHAQRDGNTAISTIAADYAAKKGIIVMNSAGNSGNDPNVDLRYVGCPADGDSVVTVGAVDVNGNYASFSSWGPNGAGKQKPNIVSVGAGTIYANSTNGNPASGNGTSYSNPNAAGLIACFWQAFPELSNMEIIDEVQKASSRYANPDMRVGYGIPDFRKAFVTVLKKRATFGTSLNTNNCGVQVSWSSKDNNTMNYKVQRKLANDTGFITINTINSTGADFSTRTYNYTDLLLDYTGGVQYRVMQYVTADTTLELGVNAVTISSACPSSLIIAPNPVKNDKLRMFVSVSNGFNSEMVIVNMMGQVVKRERKSIAKGVSVQEVNVANLAAGMYILTVYSDNKEVFSSKFIK